MEDYVHFLFITFHKAECCVLKGKCYWLMSKLEKPREMKMILVFSDSRSNTEFRRCPCKARQGHCHHLLALAYTVLNSMKKSDGASACTSKPQQRHVPRGAKIDPQVRRIIPVTSSELWWSVPTRHAKVYYFINILWNVIILLWPTGIYKINDN